MESNSTAIEGRSSAPCSPSFVPFGPEWEKEVMQHRKADLVRMFSKACRDRDGWKASHDNQVELKRIISSRPDLSERAPMVEKLVSERNEARAETIRTREFMQRGFDVAAAEIAELRSAIRGMIGGEVGTSREELAAERALADRLAALLQQDREGYGHHKVDDGCDCCDCEYLRPIDEALALWKEARK